MKLLLLILFFVSSTASAQTTDLNPSCPDAKFWQNLLSDTCWDCFFPIQVAGTKWGASSPDYNKPAGSGGVNYSSGFGPDVPSGANSESLCICFDNNGVPEFGFTLGTWLPTQLIEVVRMPYCSPTLSGTFLSSSLRMMGGNTTQGPTQKSFHHYHYFAYPILFMLDMLAEPECNPSGYFDFDLMYLSELDPTWNEDELAFYTTPELVIFSNPIALAACASDALSSSIGLPIDSLYWCAGGWGNLYPLTGNLETYSSPPRDTSLLATRVLATMHRRGVAYATVGTDNMCEAPYAPMLPKSQYKLNQFYPMPEANGNHWIGQSPYIWGEWRNIPAVGEDFLHVLWQWTDCCVR